MDSSMLFGAATVAYVLAMIAYIIYLAFRNKGIGLGATIITIAGFAAHTGAFFMRWAEFHALNVSLGHEVSILRSAPLTNLYESLIFFVWCLILGYLIIEFKTKSRSFGAFVLPIAAMALAFISISGMSREIYPLVPALQSNWLLVHVLMSFVSYAAFALAFSTGLMYMIETSKDKNDTSYIFWTVTFGVFVAVLGAMGIDLLKFNVLGHEKPIVYVMEKGSEVAREVTLLRATFLSLSKPVAVVSYAGALVFVFFVWNYGMGLKRIIAPFGLSAQRLDELTYRSIAVGFPIFTLGGLIFGAIWADQAWGKYWSWDPKETWSLITWFVYAFYLHARLLIGWKGNRIAAVAVLGFVFVIFTYLGVNLLLSGLHAYGSG